MKREASPRPAELFSARGDLAAAEVNGDSTRGRAPDLIALAHLGAVDRAVTGAQAALTEAASAIEAGEVVNAAGSLLAARVRGIVAWHAQRVADQQLYVRQHHAARDDAVLGRMLVTRGSAPW
ncbi:hypothetical protein [Cryobacterium serini]|uniref:Acyl-CoA dehydrogenase/oxidase C-terminal domain-containing protein n=1 Tax=Cryobacterium serini TaxID=1259201 RepID=A0A4R9BU78_9MICO|nr:hypothetical protein [Cryobacterium serini]TFD91185.1 hypothetical protein E3T51_00245 [Cryobacterium serini]